MISLRVFDGAGGGVEESVALQGPLVEGVRAGAVFRGLGVRRVRVDDPDVAEVIDEGDRTLGQRDNDGRVIRGFDAFDRGEAALACRLRVLGENHAIVKRGQHRQRVDLAIEPFVM